MKRWVYLFSEGSKNQKDLLGGKGANLAEMTNLGLPVPQGFTVTTEACLDYLRQEEKLNEEITQQTLNSIAKLEEQTQKGFGDIENPLLVSVRSGAKFSMPGMMDTILNLGLNDETVEALAKNSQDPRFAYDCYRRLLQMFGNVVMEINHSQFEKEIDKVKKANGYTQDNEMTAEDWQKVVIAFKKVYVKETGRDFPKNPEEQLFLAMEAVFGSWNNQRAKTYRKIHDIDDNLGTAVNVQEMVFGNFGGESGTGVVFTRNPSTGQTGLFGEYLINAQGEDVVAGIRTPKSIQELAEDLPLQYQELLEIGDKLENHYHDMQDIEFTIEAGKLFVLQTRNGKRTPNAAIRVLLDLYKENKIDADELLERFEVKDLETALHPSFSKKDLEAHQPLVTGLAASPGAAVGKVYFTAETAMEAHENGEPVILVRNETSPDDIGGMAISEAVVTCRGGMTSHAAVVARGMGICAVVGCESLMMDEEENIARMGTTVIHEGDILSVDGVTGNVYAGTIQLEEIDGNLSLQDLYEIADKKASIQVRGNAETPKDITMAMKLGATGIGLARTEHMFFEKDRLLNFRRLILADTLSERNLVLTELKQDQKQDFKFMYQAAEGRAATIRLLDPPLHEFLPKTTEETREVARDLNMSTNEVQRKVNNLAEANPMLGFRGVRLGVVYPEIYQMQVEAIMEAALEVTEETGSEIQPEIMIPFTNDAKEFARIRELLEVKIQQVFTEKQQSIPYLIGTMIEVPRACLVADQIAEYADFFSFGTNDLTQMVLGLSRDDSPRIITHYIQENLLEEDPFQVLDIDGVGAMMQMAIEKGRSIKPDLKIGICGEAAAHPKSIEFLNTLAIDYISCSPFRIPQAKVMLAKAAKTKVHN